MIILFLLLIICFILCFVYLDSSIRKLEESVEELFDLYYKKEYDFEILEEKKEDDNIVGKCVKGVRSFLDYD